MLARPHQEPRGAKLSKILALTKVLRIMAVVEGFGRVSPPLVFKTSAFSRSAKPPSEMLDVDQSFRLMPFYEGF